MGWRDVTHHYDPGEPDDDPPAEVELADCQCFECGRTFPMPADDPERFCSTECGNRWIARSQAELDAIQAAEWERELARMVGKVCVVCGAGYTDFPESDLDTCSPKCGWELVAKLYPPTGREVVDDLPY